ncbi:MAG: DUF2877 domain-containing protein [Geminicoccaceae bacterium]
MRTKVLDAASVGVLAGDALSRPSNANVFASFERSFCLDVGGTLITVGDGSLHDGPLNVRLTGYHDAAFTADHGIEVSQCWMTSPDRLRRTDGLTVNLANAIVWQPEIPAAGPNLSKPRDGLNNLLALLQERDLENDGLIRLVLPDPCPRTPTERTAMPHIEALKTDLPRWLSDDIPPDPNPAIQLLGLGPGLTPSGDDLLAGILIAWHHLGASEMSNRLGHLLVAASAARTTPISQAHLIAAAKGYGASPLHRLLKALIADRRAELAETLDAVAKIGHSSGMDAVAGMVLALTAWLQADRNVPINA